MSSLKASRAALFPPIASSAFHSLFEFSVPLLTLLLLPPPKPLLLLGGSI
jgi:hypothetical protein